MLAQLYFAKMKPKAMSTMNLYQKLKIQRFSAIEIQFSFSQLSLLQ